jgi:choice-of-anchor C domain-containing protein
MRTVHTVLGGLAFAAAMVLPLTAQASIVPLLNGGFETVNQAENTFAPGVVTLMAGSGNLPGWTITGTSIDLVKDADWQPSPNQAGTNHYSVDLDGTPGHGAISQTVGTTAGTKYSLTFDFSDNPEAGLVGEILLDRIMGLTVTAGDATVLVNQQYDKFASSNSKSAMNYTTETVQFTAKDTSTTITFASIGQTTYTGPVIDNVIMEDVTGSTPEPASLSLLGLAGAALLVRRRRI